MLRYVASLLTASFALCIGVMPNGAAADPELPPSHSVQPELYATGFEFAEGPAFDRDGNLFVVNYRGNGNIGRITKDGTASVWCVLDALTPIEGQRSQANGLKVDSEGRLVVADAGGGRLLRISADGKSGQVLADRWNGARFNSINDVALDTKGNIYFSDPGGSNAENPIGSVYRFDIGTNAITRLATNLAFPNGLAVTVDQQHLCVGESSRYRVLIYDLIDGRAENERVLIDFPKQDEG
ncbi:MAG: SMP-30/gluconolactonase/LRE family protein, partial [Planctomycetia bacterium]|nr:SMP-30/gluconolactonase/LRE family protein [Planctomycetia bacterium]